MSSDFPYTPADLLPGLLDGWCGPCLIHGVQGGVLGPDNYPEDRRHGPYTAAPLDEWRDVPLDMECSIRSVRADEVLLNLLREETQDRVRRYLEAGVRCPECDGIGYVGTTNENSSGCDACGGSFILGKRGSGYRIPPSSLRWTLDMPPWEAAVVLWLSAVRVAARMEPVFSVETVEDVRSFYDDEAHALSEGIVVRNGPTLRCMGPDGVVTFARPEVPDVG